MHDSVKSLVSWDVNNLFNIFLKKVKIIKGE